MIEKPWHAQARELLASGGRTQAQIAKECGISTTTLTRFLSPEYRERQKRCAAQSTRRRMAEDPAYRELHRSQLKKRQRLFYLRREAKCEAYDTGRRYEDVCKAWEIAP